MSTAHHCAPLAEGAFPVGSLAAGLTLVCAATAPAAVYAQPTLHDIAGLAGTPPAVLPVAVFGRDQRTKVPKRLRTLRKTIGLLYNNRERSVCTGFCVADRVVATAAHCLYRTIGERRPNLRGFRFVLRATPRTPSSRIEGYRNRSPQQFIIAGSTRLRIEPPIDATRDWALMRLARPICKGAALPVTTLAPSDIERLARRKRLIQVSFHHDYADWQLAYSRPCAAQSAGKAKRRKRIERDFTAPDALVLHTCDTGGASSGSPLLTTDANGKLSAVAINVGTYVQTRMLVEDGKVVRRFKSDAIANTAVAAGTFAPLIEPFARADILAAADDIRQLQQALRIRGHYRAEIDGAFGPLTRSAIVAHQRGAGETLTGLPTRRLLTALTGTPAHAGASGTPTQTRSQTLTRGRLQPQLNRQRRP